MGHPLARDIQNRIRMVLLEDWDPIGVAGVPEAQDEYDSYIGPIYRLLASDASVEQLAQHLQEIETTQMGLSPRRLEGLARVANTLKTLAVAEHSTDNPGRHL